MIPVQNYNPQSTSFRINLYRILRTALILIFLIAMPLIWIAILPRLSGASIGNVLANFGITRLVQGHHHFHMVELRQLQLVMPAISMANLVI